MGGERLGDLLGRRADVDEEGAAVGNEGGGGETDRSLLGCGHETTRFVGDVLDAGGDDGAAVHARQKVAVAEFVQILADRLDGNVISPGQVLDGDPAGDPGKRDDLCLAGGKIVHHVGRVSPRFWSVIAT